MSGIASRVEKSKEPLLFPRPKVNTAERHTSIGSLGRVLPLLATHGDLARLYLPQSYSKAVEMATPNMFSVRL